MRRARLAVLLPPLLPLVGCAAYALYDPAGLIAVAKGASDWILGRFDWLFSWASFGFLILLGAAYASPLGKQTIGGRGAERLLSPWRWFAVTACTTIATGILFWGIAEPVFHVSDPPPAGVGEPEVFALSTLFLHWTLTPYAIYTVGALIFALRFYGEGEHHARRSFSLLTLVSGTERRGGVGAVIDAVCLFALVAGMAASLGAGTLALYGGLAGYLGADAGAGPVGLGLIIAAIVLAFSVSAATGLQRGIRLLSNLNIVGFIGLAVFVFVSGPVGEVVALSGRALVDFAVTFVPRNLGIDPGIPKE